jgi:hypothetical protein
MTDAQAYRHVLFNAGYYPLPLYGKEPPIYGKNNPRKGLRGWHKLQDTITDEVIDMWSKMWPDAINTGCLCRLMPTLDLDILNEEAARAIEDFVRERFEERGYILVRIGLPPKRAIPFRAAMGPFKGFTINLIAPNGSEGEKVEFKADGQQLVVSGIHPDTGQPYRWFGGELGQTPQSELPDIREDEARALVDDIVEVLIRDFGYKRAPSRPPKGTNGTRPHEGGGGGDRDWQSLFENIRTGRELHDSLCTLAAKLIACGTNSGAAINQLRALMEASNAPKDERWRARVREIPEAVDSAVAKYGKQPEPEPGPAKPAAEAKPSAVPLIDKTIATFEKWLILKDRTPIYAMLGTVAANQLPGDPVWLGLVGPPSSAKTELLNSIAPLPNMVPTATVTMAALLSGVPKKQRAASAKGGLLRQIGNFGYLLLKDFGSVLSMRPEAKAEVLGALREIYDGAWTRQLGSDGGITLHWAGKIGILFGVTGVIDAHYSVISAMGDRFLLSRMVPDDRQLIRALNHAGAKTDEMRKELAGAVSELFKAPRREPRPLERDEIQKLVQTCALVVRLRGAVDRDRAKREIETVYGREGTGRLGLCLQQLLFGLDAIGVERKTAFEIIEAVALDSVPPLRRAAYDYLEDNGADKTSGVAEYLNLPTNTVRRALEELAAYGLVKCSKSDQKGKADTWSALPQTRVVVG